MQERIHIELPDGSRKPFPSGVTGLEIARTIGERLARDAVAVELDGELRDLGEPLYRGGRFRVLTLKDAEGRKVYRHTASHILAQALLRLYPGTKLAIGPAVEDGFYYDVESPHRFSEADFAAIEAEMARIVEADLPVVRKVRTKAEALELYRDNPYKREILEEIPDETVTFYGQGEFEDLCRGPHLPSTGRVKLVKLLKVAGAYWRGSEKNPMLQRLYGEAFASEAEWEERRRRMEEAERRDHRRLGRELDLFSVQEEAGPGLVFWHPNGAAVRAAIEAFWREEHQRRGYRWLYTPHIADSRLWETSGHLENYAENMFPAMRVDERDYLVKPMNCPFHILVYRSALRSYRDLPLRWAEMGTVYRYEKSGVLHGMLRVRGFTQDDAHIFCRPDQLEAELREVIGLAFHMLRTFGFDEYRVMLATRPEKAVGDPEVWDRATQALRSALEAEGVGYAVDAGGGAFYGPKIDVKLVDAIGREWQGPTIQVDFNLPERFDLTYVGADGQRHRPVMVHRAVLGSMERFVGTLVEHYAGRLPYWLSPVQAVVLPVTPAQEAYARSVEAALRQALVRVEADLSENKLGYKVREAQVRQVPYMLVVGEREASAGTVSLRRRDGTDEGSLPLAEVVERLARENRERAR